jgi:hypothetical protein
MLAVEFVLILILAIHALQLRSRIEELSERVSVLEFPAVPRHELVVEAMAVPAREHEPEPAGPSLSDRLRAVVGTTNGKLSSAAAS